MDTGTEIFVAGNMKISFSRHDRYPGADIEIELIESGRVPSMAAWFKVAMSGDKADRELLRNSMTDWAKRRRINMKSRCGMAYDTHEGYLRYWTHVSEFLSYWVGDRNFSRMLEDASRAEFRLEMELAQIAKQIALLRAAPAGLEQRLTAAAKAFLSEVG